MPTKRTRKPPPPLPETPKFKKAKAEIANVIQRGFAPTPAAGEPDAVWANPKNITTALYTIIEKFFSPPAPVAENLSAVSDETDEKFEHRVMVERPITRQLVRAMQHRVKKIFFWSAKDMASYLNVDRSTLKKIESGSRTMSEEFENRFRSLERHVAAWTFETRDRDKQIIIIESAYPMPRRTRALRRHIACKRCKKYFEPHRWNHKYCHTKDCDAIKKKRRKKKTK